MTPFVCGGDCDDDSDSGSVCGCVCGDCDDGLCDCECHMYDCVDTPNLIAILGSIRGRPIKAKTRNGVFGEFVTHSTDKETEAFLELGAEYEKMSKKLCKPAKAKAKAKPHVTFKKAKAPKKVARKRASGG